MPTLLIFLRAINVGGNNKLAMADLKSLLHNLGLSNPITHLNSGNVLVRTPDPVDLPALESQIQAAIHKHHNLTIDVLLRTADHLRTILAHNPFPDFAAKDPAHLLIMFCNKAPNAQNLTRLRSLIQGPEEIAAHQRELYITYPNGIGTSKLTGTLIEKSLHLRGTARNLNTLQKLLALTT